MSGSSASTTSARAGDGTIGLARAVATELLRAKGSAAARFAGAGAVLAVLQGLGWLAVHGPATRDWTSLFGWQSLYATGLMAPVATLLAATVAAREERARDGGTWARPLAAGTAMWARGLVMAWQSLLFHVALFAPMLVLGAVGGLREVPVGAVATLCLVSWMTSLVPLVGGFALARRFGMVVAVAAAALWQAVGTVFAESSVGWAFPWSWGVRAVMPVLEIHANAVGLEPDSPIRTWSPWAPATASAVLAVVLLAVLARIAAVGHRAGSGRRPRALRHADGQAVGVGPSARSDLTVSSGEVARGRIRPLAAHVLLLRGTAVWPLVAVTVLTVAVVAVVRDAAFVAGLATWLVVPVGCSLLACLVWAAMAPAWHLAVTRARPRDLAVAAFGLCWSILLAVVLWVFGVAAVSGGVSVGFPIMLLAVGTMTLTVDLWLATRFGTAATLGVTLTVLVVSLVFGGTAIADSPLWIVGVVGWPLTATTSPRMLVVLLVSGAVTVAAAAAWCGALRRAARG